MKRRRTIQVLILALTFGGSLVAFFTIGHLTSATYDAGTLFASAASSIFLNLGAVAFIHTLRAGKKGGA